MQQPADASIQDRTPTSPLQTAEYKRATFARAAGLRRPEVKTADSAARGALAAHPAGTRAGFGRTRAASFGRRWAAGFSHKWHPS